MKTDYKSTREIKGRLLSLLLTAAMVFTLMFTLPPITVYAVNPAYANVSTYEEFTLAVANPDVDTIDVTNDFSLEGDVTIDRSVTITSDSGCTINADTHSLIVGSGENVSLGGSLSLTGTSTTVQVSSGGTLRLPASYTGTISTTGAGGKALYAVGGTAAVNIAGGTISAGPNANSALCLGDTHSVTVSGGTISGSGGAYDIYMEQGYGTLSINISESGPGIDDVYYYWNPSDAPELAGDYPLLTSLPAPISMHIGEVMTLDVESFIGDEVQVSYHESDRVPELNVGFVWQSDNLTLSPDTTGVYNLILRIRGVKLTIPVTVTSSFNGGNGTWDDPYQIATAEQLDRVRNFLGSAYKDTYFILTAPIDLSSYSNWEPIGDFANPFCGNFFGAVYDSESETYITHTVSNLTIDQPDTSYVGLFGYCASACIEGVAIRNANVTGGTYSDTGALVGQSVGYIGGDYQPTQIRYCSASGSVTAVDGFAVGGLVGMATDTQITQSYSTAGVTGALSSYAGGLVGYLNSGSIDNSYAAGPVTTTGTDMYAGGLVGWIYSADCSIYHCYAAGKVTGEGETGGLIGHSNTFNIGQSYFNVANAGSSDNGSKGIGVNTINLIYQSSFEDWDFDIYLSEIWRIDPGASYPYLRLNEQIPHPAPPAATSARIVDESGDSRYNAATKTLTMTYGGGEASLSAEDVTPADGLVMWSSSDTAVTDIWWGSSGDIHIEVKGAGTATASLKSSDRNTLDSITVIVEPMPLMVSGEFEVENKVYDGSENAFITNTTLSLDTTYCIGDDAANLTANFVATFSDPDVGQNKTVSLSASTLAGSAAGNYVLDFSNVSEVTGTIIPKELTIGGSFTAQDKVHDGMTDAAIAWNNLTLIGKVGNDDVTLVPVLAFDTPDIATGKTVSLTTDSSLTGAKAGNYTLSIIGAPTCTSGLITEKEATLGGSFTVDNKEYSGDKAATIATNNLTLVGIDPGDDVSIASVTAEFDSAVVGDGKTVRITGVTLTGADAGDYTVPLTGAPTATANITVKPLTITGSFTVEDRQYDGTVNAVIDTSTLMLNGIIGSDIVSLNASAAFDDANVGTGKTVTLAGSSGGSGSSSSGSTSSTDRLEIPSSFISDPNSNKTLTLENDFASVTIPSDMLDNIPGIAVKKAEISIGQANKSSLPDDVKATIGDRPLISLSLLIDGKQTDWSNPDAPVTVSIPYTPTADELNNPDSIAVWYIDGSGNPQCVTNGRYDPVTGTVTFEVTHFSDYAVVYNLVRFNDVTPGAWYYKAVSFIAARDITGGTGGGNFSPDAYLTRGDFLVMLMKAYGIAPDTSPADNFSDAGNIYYTGYLAAAKRLGISAGVGNNMYAPGREITRQEMFTLLYNALKVIGQLPRGDSGRTFSDFSDAGLIESWAKEALTLLVKTGTVGGSAGKLSPTSTTTRAEMAQVLYNLLGR